MKMRPGHEDCGHSIDRSEIGVLGQKDPFHVIDELTCHHDHSQKLFASDGILEIAVGRYCECCDQLHERF